jgi:uncharacterized protein (UPF0147 family)
MLIRWTKNVRDRENKSYSTVLNIAKSVLDRELVPRNIRELDEDEITKSQ